MITYIFLLATVIFAGLFALTMFKNAKLAAENEELSEHLRDASYKLSRIHHFSRSYKVTESDLTLYPRKINLIAKRRLAHVIIDDIITKHGFKFYSTRDDENNIYYHMDIDALIY